jgi:hypothetical protein
MMIDEEEKLERDLQRRLRIQAQAHWLAKRQWGLDDSSLRSRIATQERFLRERGRFGGLIEVPTKRPEPRFYATNGARLQVPPGWSQTKMVQAAAEIRAFCTRHPWAKVLFYC